MNHPIRNGFLSIFFCLALSIALIAPNQLRALEPPVPFTIFVAASMAEAIEAAAQKYEADLDADLVTVSVSGSGTLARQIELGAPAHVFISADRIWIDYLAEKRLIEAEAATLIAGTRLVLVSRSGIETKGTLQDRLLELAESGRLAIGEPETVPAGRYAKEAIERLGIWDAIEKRLVPTNSVRTALALVQRGEVDGAIVYETDASLAPELPISGTFLPGLHTPIGYWAVALNDAPWTAFQFVVKLGSQQGQDIFTDFGFATP